MLLEKNTEIQTMHQDRELLIKINNLETERANMTARCSQVEDNSMQVFKTLGKVVGDDASSGDKLFKAS